MARSQAAESAGNLPWVRIQLVRERAPRYPTLITGSEAVYRLFREEAELWDREHFLLLALDGKGRVLAAHEVSVGSLTASIVHPREIMKVLILLNAAGFIVLHNHPSGDPTPSAEDEALTARIRQAADLIGIRLLDHIVLGAGCYVSFSDTGRL